ncbi:thiamine pyrophosphokinase, catalytic domain [compost metagenome]
MSCCGKWGIGLSKLSIFAKHAPRLQGSIKVGATTKLLLQNLHPNQIVVLKHQDLDEVVAQELIDCKVKAIINCASTMSGGYPTMGPLLLLQHEIPIWEVHTECFGYFEDSSRVRIFDDTLEMRGLNLECHLFTKEEWLSKHQEAQSKLSALLDDFIENTLSHAQQEKDFVLNSLPPLELHTSCKDRHVLVVSRGSGYKRDLIALKAYIHDYSPILIGVDGGADALLANGYKPHLIIGDMDSVSDRALGCGSELIVHAYTNGYAPGHARMQSLGLAAHILPSMGTSEDIALLLAFEQEAEYIVTVGTHTHMIDFLEKGRPGMGSTLLVRMKIGAKLLDAKGVSTFYRKQRSWTTEVVVTFLLSGFFILLSFIQLRWGMQHVIKVVWEAIR